MDDHLDAVQLMQDYINEHLPENITLADLARVSGYSPWYSYRLFVQWMNCSPADYIRRLRLSKSALKLRDENIKIADIAFEIGYESVDGYQRAFFKEFGCNPSSYSVNPVPIKLFKPYRIKFSTPERITAMEGIKTIFIQVIDRPERKVIIKRGIQADEYWKYCEEVGCDVWGLLTSIQSISGEPVCLWLPPKYILPGTSRYVQGVEVPVDYNGIIPEGFDVIEFPPCKYLMFQGEPFKEENLAGAIHKVQQAIQSYDPAIIGYRWSDANPSIQLEPVGTRGYIELRAIE